MTRRIITLHAIAASRGIPAQLVALRDEGTVLRMVLADERWTVLPDAPQPEQRTVAERPAFVEYSVSTQQAAPWWGK